MLSKQIVFIVVFPFFCLLGAPVSVAEDPGEHDSLGTAPLAVYDYMRGISCAPIRGFYSGAVDTPPFVHLGVGFFAFVCERQYGNADAVYDLVVEARDDGRWHPFAPCPQVINLAARPGGLRLARRSLRREDWSSFFRLGNVAVTLESSGRGRCLQGELPMLALDTRDGFTEYTCINDEWYFSPVDMDE